MVLLLSVNVMDIKTVFLEILLKLDCYKYQNPGAIGRHFCSGNCIMAIGLFFCCHLPAMYDTAFEFAGAAKLLKRVINSSFGPAGTVIRGILKPYKYL